MFLVNKTEQCKLPSIYYKGKELPVKCSPSGCLNRYESIFISCKGTDMLDFIIDFNKSEFYEIFNDQAVNMGDISFEDGRLCLDIPREYINRYISFEMALNDWITDNNMVLIDKED